MVETIVPVVYGRRTRYLRAVALHALAAAAAAALTGALLGAAGTLLGAPWPGAPLIIAAVAALYAGRELLGLPLPLPELRRQVPLWWRSFFAPEVAAVLYGAGLGPGFTTYLGSGALAAVGTAALAYGGPLLGASLMAPFGLARGLALLIGARADDHDAAAEIAARLSEAWRGGRPRLLSGVALAALAALAGALA